MTRRRLLLALLALAVPAGAQRAKPPAPTFRIVKLEVIGDATILTVAGGSMQGVDKTWRAYLVKVDGTIDNAAEIMIIRVSERTVVTKANKSRDQILGTYNRVAFSPP